MAEEDPPGFKDGAEVIAFRHPETEQPVPVSRELALAESRSFKAYTDWLNGVSWEQISDTHGYADARAAAYDIQRYQESARALYNSFTVHQKKALQLARLERLLSGVSKNAVEGNVAAVREAANLIKMIIALEQLDQAGEDNTGGPATTIIVGGTEDDFIGALEKEDKPPRAQQP